MYVYIIKLEKETLYYIVTDSNLKTILKIKKRKCKINNCQHSILVAGK